MSTHPLSGRARFFAAVIAITAGLALAAQPTLGEGSYLENAAAVLRFFTIWSNVAACIVMTLAALGKPAGRGIMAALATALTVVCVVYWALLSGEHHPVGFDRVTNQSHHTFVPLATIAWWFAYAPRAERIAPLLPAVMVPPLAYGVFALILGQLTGFYAYFFLDQPALGWGQFGLNNALLTVFFAGLGALLIALHRRFGATR